MKHTILLAVAVTGIMHAQTYSNATLNAKYYYRELYFTTDASGNPTDVRSQLGAITFDGKGGYTTSAYQNLGISPVTTVNQSGTYGVNANATMSISDPFKPGLMLNARFTPEAVFGSSSDATDNTFAFFIAIPQPVGGFTIKSLSSTYFVSTLELPGASSANMRSALATIQPDGRGNIPSYSVTGHSAAVSQGFPVTVNPAGAAYKVNSDGSGSIDFGSSDPYVAGNKMIYISKSGNMFIGGSTDPGSQDLLIGVKGVDTSKGPPTSAAWTGGYFTAGIRVDPVHMTTNCYTGALNSNGASTYLFTHKLREAGIATSHTFTGSQTYFVNPSGLALAADYNWGLGTGGLIVSAQASPQDYTAFEIGFGSAYPAYAAGTGPYVSPWGIVNAAGNAPGAPLSPGEFVTAYGLNLAPQTLQAGAPYPLALGGVTVTVNGVAAPIYLVSANQVNFLVPYSVTGATAAVVIKNAAGTSNTVSIPLSATSPGIYSVDLSGAGSGVVLHADYSLVTKQSPAMLGETVLVYLTGLGAVTPTVPDGVAAPSDPLSKVGLKPLNVYLDNVPLAVQFAGLAPGFPGLYQLNVTIPNNKSITGPVALGIETPDAYHEQVSICVQYCQ